MITKTRHVTSGGVELFDMMMLEFPELKAVIDKTRKWKRNYKLDWQKKNPEKIKKYAKNYYRIHKEQCDNITKRWKEKNKDKYLQRIREYNIIWRKKNPGKAQMYALRSYHKNKHKYKERMQKYNIGYYARNRDKIIRYGQMYRRKNKLGGKENE